MMARWLPRARRSSRQLLRRSLAAGSRWAPSSATKTSARRMRSSLTRFELGVCPVTRADYECFGECHQPRVAPRLVASAICAADLPVVGVSWIDAVAYCAWRSEQDDRPVRLPTEAEWEFAARGLQETLFPWGDVMPEWIPNGGHGPLQAPWPVTLGEPTDFGLLGISTNVHEWCADWHDKDYYSRLPERNPRAPTKACDAPRAAERGATRTPCAASPCAVSSIRPSATTTLDFASREASEPILAVANDAKNLNKGT